MATVDDPTCPLCSKPVRSGSFVLYEHGELLHVVCRSRVLQVTAMDSVARADAAQQRAAHLVREQARRGRIRQHGPCPVCGEPAILLDWRPSVPWLAIEGCACNAVFVWTALLDGRLSALSPEDRGTLSLDVQRVRKMGTEAWLTTSDGTPGGELIIRDTRPDRPT
jgi:hypothetical protein